MSIEVLQDLDFTGGAKIINLPDAVSDQQPVTLAQLKSQVEGLNWKDSVRVSTQANINLASPGATIDGVTMATNDRFVARAQTAGAENGIYIWNGAATPATRSLDMDTAAEVEQAVVVVEEGTSAGSTYRQTAVNVTLGTTSLAWTTFGTAAGSASETSSGIAEIATQAETDAGTDDSRFITALKLATSPFASKKFNTDIGDGSATSYVVTHNLGTRDVIVQLRRNSGTYAEVIAQIERTSTNTCTIVFAAAPASNSIRVLVRT